MTTKNPCPVGIAFNKNGEAFPLECGQWTCIHCAKKLASKWAWRTKLHIAATHKPAWFLTLTVRGYIRDVGYAYKMLPTWFDNFRKMMQRGSTGVFEYIAFVEGQMKTRGGMPHFHIISLQYPLVLEHCKKDGKWVKLPSGAWKYKKVKFKEIAWRAGFGFETDMQLVSSGKAAAYVAKYASKIDAHMPKGFRRVRTSQGWHELPELPETTVYIRSQTETLYQFLLRVNAGTEVNIDELRERYERLNSAIFEGR